MIQGFADELEDAASDRGNALYDPVEHIFHRPCILTDFRGSHQAAAALEGVERAAYRNQRVAVAGIGVPSHEAIRQYLDDLAGLVDEHLEDFVVDLRLLDFRPYRRRRRLGTPGDIVVAGLVGGTLQREYAVFGELQQRVVIGLQSDHRFQIVFEPPPAHRRAHPAHRPAVRTFCRTAAKKRSAPQSRNRSAARSRESIRKLPSTTLT